MKKMEVIFDIFIVTLNSSKLPFLKYIMPDIDLPLLKKLSYKLRIQHLKKKKKKLFTTFRTHLISQIKVFYFIYKLWVIYTLPPLFSKAEWVQDLLCGTATK